MTEVTQVFISHATEDAEFAHRLAQDLRASGLEVWIAPESIDPGEEWVSAIDRGLTASSHLLIVLTPAAVASQWVQTEVNVALDLAHKGKMEIIPLDVIPVELPPVWGALQKLTGFGADYPKGLSVLAGRLGHQIKPADSSAALDLTRPSEPGDLPPGSRMTFGRNARFTGRVQPLLDLACALLPAAAQPTVVTQMVQGMGGIGKTQLAVEFAYRYGRYFQGVHWIAAAEPDLIGAEIAECGRKMALSPWPEAQPEQVERTLRAWRDGGPSLIVLDNLEDLEAAREWLPRLQGSALRLMLTARRSDWPGYLGLSSLRLDTFSPEESLQFLRQTLPASRASEAELLALAERLGRLPLALELAARYLKRLPRLSAPGYLGRLDNLFADAAMAGWREELGNPTGHDLDLVGTFRLSWDEVEDEDARRLFLAAGHCAPNQPIPCELLEAALQSWKARGLIQKIGKLFRRRYPRLDLDETLFTLTGLGLLEMQDTDAGPTIHPLLAEYARTLPGAGEALSTLAGALATATLEAWQTGLPAAFVPLRPHAEAAAPTAEAAGLDSAGTLWNNLGLHLRMVADYAGARAAIEQALDIWIEAHGESHPRVATANNNLGSVLKDLGDLAGARAAIERALAIDEAAHGPEHPEVATDVSNLGFLLHDLGDLAGARAAYERALAINEAVYGSDHPDVATAVNNLGSVLQDLGDLPGARAAYERALEIWTEAHGENHPRVAIANNNLGMVLKDLGDLAGARAAIERALAIDEAVYGLDHPSVARDANNLGNVLHDLGDLAAARAAFERAREIWTKAYGEHHPQVATGHSNLGSVLRDLGDLAGARSACERALAIDEAVYGPDHPSVANDVNNLGGVLRALGDLAGARAAVERALAIDEAIYGPYHPEVATDVNNLGMVLKAKGDLAGARAAFERALAICEAMLGVDHPRTRLVRKNLASLDE